MENWISMINYDYPGRAKLSEKMRRTEISNFHDSEENNVTFPKNSSSKGFTNEFISSGEKTLFARSKAPVHGRRKQPNTEMREELLTKRSKTVQQSVANNFDENFHIDELPCSKEGGKWVKIRMYQERARRREARRRRQRQKEREESRGSKSKRRKSRKRSKSRKRRKSSNRSKSRKRRKSSNRSKSRKRSKSNGRKKRGKSRSRSRSRSRKSSRSGSRRRSKSGNRKKSRNGSRKRSAKRTARRRRQRST